ncbi:MAG: DUF1428 domain-containing protein [Gammaproteobacteria bacterium]
MYIAVLAIPVPESNLDAYKTWAENSARIFKKYGCLQVIDGWDDFVPRGKQTDFYRAVNAKEGEKIVVSIQLWPDKECFFASEDKMHEDNALDVEGEIPFDASRLITGCFSEL